MSEPGEPLSPSRPARRLGPARLVAFSLLSLLGFLALLEGGLQVLAATQGPQHLLPEDGSLAAPDPDAMRVLAVGDSWVYGAESEPHEAFIEVFARAAAAEIGGPVQIYNLGVSASNSAQALLAVQETVAAVRPDLVVALTGANNGLHDKGVAAAARLMGEDARLVPGLAAIAGLRTVRLARLIWVNLTAPPPPPEGTVAPTMQIAGGAGLPTAPPAHTTPIVRLPWWDLFVARRWDDALTVLTRASSPSSDPRVEGTRTAWRALLRAHLDDLDGAERDAAAALAVGGDEATAWEARAVIGAQQGRPLVSFQMRVRAAMAPGHPWIRERARGLALLEIEALEAARDWLISVQRATPGELDTLIGLARLPTTVRTEEVDALLFGGPRGVVDPGEYFDWHLASSGMKQRAADSLGAPDPGETVALRLLRARADELLGREEEARAAYAALAIEAVRPVDVDRGRAGVVRLTADPGAIATALGASPDALLEGAPGTETALALVGWFERTHACDQVLLAAVAALEAGALPQQLERVVGPCVPGSVSIALTEMALSRGVAIDRAALIVGAESTKSIAAPTEPTWRLLQERAFDRVPVEAPIEWRALGHAMAGEPGRALELIGRAHRVRDPGVLALAEGLALRSHGQELDALAAFARAAEGQPTWDPWARLLARGFGEASAGRWATAQDYLLSALSVAPGQYEILRALADMPAELRTPATEVALRDAPSGRVAVDQWVDWYLDASREPEARIALRWRFVSGAAPADRVRRGIATARVLWAQGEETGARAEIAATVAALGAAPSADLDPSWTCEALTLRLRIGGKAAAEEEVQALLAKCDRYAPAWASAGAARASRGDCGATTEAARATIERGGDPDLLTDWMEPCVSRAMLREWVGARSEDSPLARSWMLERITPLPTSAAPAAAPTEDVLIRHLAAMRALAEDADATFLALTYPFPSGHHAGVRDRILRAGAAHGVATLDLYGVFEQRYSETEWRALRTPEDHVNASGYRVIGEELTSWARATGLLVRERREVGKPGPG